MKKELAIRIRRARKGGAMCLHEAGSGDQQKEKKQNLDGTSERGMLPLLPVPTLYREGK